MGRKRKNIFYDVKILDISSEGKAIAKVNDFVFFVNNAIPGDIVDLKVVKKKKNYAEATAIKFHHYSDIRIKEFCEHFGICGGCKWQSLPYEKQLFYKQKQVLDAFERIGKSKISDFKEILPSDETKYYRNKLEFTFSNYRWLTRDEINLSDNKFEGEMNGLGFHIPKRFDKIIDVKHCYLQREPSNEIRLFVKNYALENNLTFFDLKKQNGFLRNLIIRTSSTTNDLMVIIAFFYENKEKREKLLNSLYEKFEISSLMYVINTKKNDSISDLKIENFKGKDFIVEKMEDLKFKIGAKSFYQTNSMQAISLYNIVKDFSQLNGDEVVYDLYTGTGTIANFLSKKSKKVIGIEFIEEAIEDAKINSKINDIKNTKFFSGDMKNILTESFFKKNSYPDVIIIDPPRAGMHKKVIENILKTDAEKIIYVSCNPATQSRDFLPFIGKYFIEKLQAVDMFPHTYHVENVILMKKIKK